MPNAATAQPLTSFTFDSTALAKYPSASIPTSTVTLKSFSTSVIGSSLLATSETFVRQAGVGTRQFSASNTWELETDPQTGAVLATSNRLPGVVATVPSETTLQAISLRKLSSFGVTSAEVARVLQRRAMRQDFDGTVAEIPQLHKFKTFVFRGLGGIEVEGHRAVLSYGRDGVLDRALVKWPALATTGHLLHTRTTIAEIEKRATLALEAAGETEGAVQLFWRYLPVQQTTGEVTLKLVATAHIKSGKNLVGAPDQEPRLIDVDVDALP